MALPVLSFLLVEYAVPFVSEIEPVFVVLPEALLPEVAEPLVLVDELVPEPEASLPDIELIVGSVMFFKAAMLINC